MDVHPVAALFPMMTDEELDDLAADIAANGLIHPLVRDADGQLIDGRNRAEACRRAGVEPRWEELDGRDAVAYILAANVQRRHLSKGQTAMAVARACVLTQNGSMRDVARAAGTSAARIAYAAVVLDHAPDLADAVLSGAVPLDEAYTAARQRKEAAASLEARFGRLQVTAPDLAALVVEARMSIEDAVAAAADRVRRLEEQRQAALGLLRRTTAGLVPESDPPAVWAARLAGLVDPDVLRAEAGVTPARLRHIAAGLSALADAFEGGDDGDAAPDEVVQAD